MIITDRTIEPAARDFLAALGAAVHAGALQREPAAVLDALQLTCFPDEELERMTIVLEDLTLALAEAVRP